MPKRRFHSRAAALFTLVAMSMAGLTSCAPQAGRPVLDQSQAREINDIAHYLDG